MNQKGRGQDCFQTPKHIFNQLNSIFNFTLDAAASDENHLCPIYFKESIFGGLARSWWKHRVFVNPPFSEKADWMEKAHNEVLYGDCPLVVMILPSLCMDTVAFHKFVQDKFHYEVLEGRISFIDPETGKAKSGNNSGTVIVYFKKKIKTKE